MTKDGKSEFAFPPLLLLELVRTRMGTWIPCETVHNCGQAGQAVLASPRRTLIPTPTSWCSETSLGVIHPSSNRSIAMGKCFS